jgi:hypothetical protein
MIDCAAGGVSPQIDAIQAQPEPWREGPSCRYSPVDRRPADEILSLGSQPSEFGVLLGSCVTCNRISVEV